MSDMLIEKKLVGPFLKKTVFLSFGVKNLIWVAVILLTFFDPSNGLKVENSIFGQNPPWEYHEPLLGSKNLRIKYDPPKKS